MTKHLFPTLMGGAMGLMMLMMVHNLLTSPDGSAGGMALVIFVGAHVAVVALLLIAGFFATRSTGPMQRLLSRLHRPSRAHIGAMLLGMALSGSAAHLFLHGGLI